MQFRTLLAGLAVAASGCLVHAPDANVVIPPVKESKDVILHQVPDPDIMLSNRTYLPGYRIEEVRVEGQNLIYSIGTDEGNRLAIVDPHDGRPYAAVDGEKWFNLEYRHCDSCGPYPLWEEMRFRGCREWNRQFWRNNFGYDSETPEPQDERF